MDTGSQQPGDSWSRLRGALRDVFADLGGGETYLTSEREQFRSLDDRQPLPPPPE